MPWEDKCKWLKNNPVTAARHFDYKVQQFFKIMILKNRVLGEVKHYFIRTEFQQRGSPHVHCVIWVKNAPVCGRNSEQEICAFVDKYVSCQLPCEKDDPELFQLVSTLQQHRHTRTCRKSGVFCRFHFPKISVPFTLLSKDKNKDNTTTTTNNIHDSYVGDQNSMTGENAGLETSSSVMNNTVSSNKTNLEEPPHMETHQIDYKDVLKKVGKCISSCKDNNILLTLQEVLNMCSIKEDIYAEAIRQSESSVKIFHKRDTCDESVNNYNAVILKSWEANMDLQYVTDVYACIKYIVSYVTKDERQLSDLLRNASKQAHNTNLRQQLKDLGNVFLIHREVSAQEAIYRVLPIPLKRTSVSVVFIPSDMEEDRVRLVKPSHLLENLDDESEDIFCNVLPDRYAARPDTLEYMCLADFASSYTSYTEPTDDFQTVDMTSSEQKGKVIKLKNSKGYMRKRQQTCIVRTHTYSKFKNPEKYFHSKLMMYKPWRREDDLKAGCRTYEEAYSQSHAIVGQNMERFEQNSEAVDNAVDSLSDDPTPTGAWEIINSETIQQDLEDSCAPHAADPDSAILDPNFHTIPNFDTVAEIGDHQVRYTVIQHLLPDEDYRALVRNLNVQQRQLLEYKLEWCRSYSQGRTTGSKPEPFYTFLTGGAGTGKSVLIKAIYNMAVRELRAEGDSPDDCTVLLLAPTGTAAFNINGQTVHSALRLPIKQHSSSQDYFPLSQEKLQDLRCKLKNLTLVIIDEISMIGAQQLYTIHRRLMEIKGVTSSSTYFGGVSIFAVGDLYQLPPVCEKPVFALPKSPLARLAGSIWMQLFKLYHLEQIMRQKDDIDFALALNRIRTQDHTREDIAMLQSRIISPEHPDYPHDALHLFADNKHVDQYNHRKLQTIPTQKVLLNAKDVKPTGCQIPDNISLPDNPAFTGGLVKQLTLAIGARVMVTKNMDVQDGLTNGTQGLVVGFYPEVFDTENQIIAVMVQCDTQSSGAQTRHKYKQLERQYPHAVPIFRDEVRVSISSRGGNYVSRLQFPLRLAWACTIHKIQGMTLQHAVVSFQGRFFHGQCYVALSRVSSLSGLFITDYADNKITASSATTRAMKEMSTNCLSIVLNPITQKPTNMLSISLLNVRSLTRHYPDIQAHQDLDLVDVNCLTETWLKKQKSIQVLGKTVFRQDRPKKQSGGVIMYVSDSFKPQLILTYSDRNMELVTVKVGSLSIMLVYVSVNASRSQAVLVLQEKLQNLEKPVIVLGDFNKTPHALSDILTPVINVSTTNTGSTLDQVYVSEDIHPCVHLSTPYFSDHQIIWIGVNLQSLESS